MFEKYYCNEIHIIPPSTNLLYITLIYKKYKNICQGAGYLGINTSTDSKIIPFAVDTLGFFFTKKKHLYFNIRLVIMEPRTIVFKLIA